MTVIMDSFWSSGAKDYNSEQNLNFTLDALQEVHFKFQKVTFWRKLKNWSFSNHCFCRLVSCISMKLDTFVQRSFVVITDKSEKICLNIFGDSVIQNLKNGKTRKCGLVPLSRQERLRIYSWYSLPDFKIDPKHVIRIPSLNVPEMRHFLVNFIKQLPWKSMTVRKILTSVLAMYFYVLWPYQVSLPSSGREKVINDQNFQSFCFWPS